MQVRTPRFLNSIHTRTCAQSHPRLARQCPERSAHRITTSMLALRLFSCRTTAVTSLLHCNMLHKYLQCRIATHHMPDDCARVSLDVRFKRAAPRPPTPTRSPNTPAACTAMNMSRRSMPIAHAHERRARGATSAARPTRPRSTCCPRRPRVLCARNITYTVHCNAPRTLRYAHPLAGRLCVWSIARSVARSQINTN